MSRVYLSCNTSIFSRIISFICDCNRELHVEVNKYIIDLSNKLFETSFNHTSDSV